MAYHFGGYGDDVSQDAADSAAGQLRGFAFWVLRPVLFETDGSVVDGAQQVVGKRSEGEVELVEGVAVGGKALDA